MDIIVEIAHVKLTPVEERNVHTHAAASEVPVVFEIHQHRPRLTIADNGLGFGQAIAEVQRHDGHLGVTLMHDLADELDASLEMVSAPGRGTTMLLTLRDNE